MGFRDLVETLNIGSGRSLILSFSLLLILLLHRLLLVLMFLCVIVLIWIFLRCVL